MSRPIELNETLCDPSGRKRGYERIVPKIFQHTEGNYEARHSKTGMTISYNELIDQMIMQSPGGF